MVNYVSQVAEALQYAHDQGVIHLDVKPENMLLSANENVLLADFGIARFNYSVSQKLSSVIGTVAYMAPEFLQSRPRPASDQYALAMVAYEWLIGSCAFTGISGQSIALQHMTIPPPPLRDHDAAISVTIDQVILKALSKDPEDRYPSVSSFAQALAQASTTDTNQRPTTPYKAGLQARQLRLKTPYTRNWGQPLGQGDAATAKVDHQAQIQLQQGKPDQHEDTLDQSEQQKRFRMAAFGPQLHHRWIVSLVWGIFLVGIGTTVGALTQSWIIALLVLAIAGIGGYFLGYHKALDKRALVIPSGASFILTLALTLILGW